MNYCFHPSAKQELNLAIEYYENCQQGLGEEFAKEIFATIIRITRFPEAWSILSENTRRCLTNRFPYGIIYQILDDNILIIAVMQLNRSPDYWRVRLKKDDQK
jgi:hypothetical protein